jgi:hypothetical protein
VLGAFARTKNSRITLAEEENNIAFHYLDFLVAFTTWPVCFGEEIDKTKDDCCYWSAALDQDSMQIRFVFWIEPQPTCQIDINRHSRDDRTGGLDTEFQ